MYLLGLPFAVPRFVRFTILKLTFGNWEDNLWLNHINIAKKYIIFSFHGSHDLGHITTNLIGISVKFYQFSIRIVSFKNWRFFFKKRSLMSTQYRTK